MDNTEIVRCEMEGVSLLSSDGLTGAVADGLLEDDSTIVGPGPTSVSRVVSGFGSGVGFGVGAGVDFGVLGGG